MAYIIIFYSGNMKIDFNINEKNSITITVIELSNNRKRISVPLDTLSRKKTKMAIDILRNIDNNWLNKQIYIKKRENRKNKLTEIWKI